MFKTIEEYLDALKIEMQGSDPALLQDALADAREHLETALEATHQSNAKQSDADALKTIIEEYGSPEETATAYREVEFRTSPSLKKNNDTQSWIKRFFGVYTDPRTWGSLLFMLISFVTGTIYFVWAVTGVSLSASLMILIIGLPVTILFLLSVRGLALLEGRLVEALLGIRMPRRALFSHADMKWLDRLKALITDKVTWLMLVYMVIQFILGTLYFVSIVTVFSVSLLFMAIPILQIFLPAGNLHFGPGNTTFPVWAHPMFVMAGFLLWTTFMNIVRGVGQLHGRFAKWMLVTE